MSSSEDGGGGLRSMWSIGYPLMDDVMPFLRNQPEARNLPKNAATPTRRVGPAETAVQHDRHVHQSVSLPAAVEGSWKTEY